MLGDQILHFFEFFLLFIRYFTKLLFFSGPELSKNNSFVKYLINNKKIQKYVIFDLQAFCNIEIMLNGLDFENCKIECCKKCVK